MKFIINPFHKITAFDPKKNKQRTTLEISVQSSQPSAVNNSFCREKNTIFFFENPLRPAVRQASQKHNTITPTRPRTKNNMAQNTL